MRESADACRGIKASAIVQRGPRRRNDAPHNALNRRGLISELRKSALETMGKCEACVAK